MEPKGQNPESKPAMAPARNQADRLVTAVFGKSRKKFIQDNPRRALRRGCIIMRVKVVCGFG
jgi:hypothetical protein